LLRESVLNQWPGWVEASAPESVSALWVECTLSRNLAEFPFPGRAHDDEARAVEERVLQALDHIGLASRGAYYSFQELSYAEQRMLLERRLATEELLMAKGPRGVFINADQTLCVMINGLDHVCLRALASGIQAEAAWRILNGLDDQLGRMLDYAYSQRLGYLSSVLDNVGTGLRVRGLFHLPGCTQADEVKTLGHATGGGGLLLCGVCSGASVQRIGTAEPLGAEAEAWARDSLHADIEGAILGGARGTLGDLYVLGTHGTLGKSEAEMTYAFQSAAAEIVSAEESARAKMFSQSRTAAEDRIGRALGTARGARMLGFEESMQLLSSLRLGVAAHVLVAAGIERLNELLLGCQAAHLAVGNRDAEGALRMSQARADLFRGVFGPL